MITKREMDVPKIRVGIMSEKTIHFILNADFSVEGKIVSGDQYAKAEGGKVRWNESLADEILFYPTDSDKCSFTLVDVTIGVNFHWERKENQKFLGALKLINENGKVTAINVLNVEDYLVSVISSEMSATASLNLLKSHAVISRSWLLAQIEKNKNITAQSQKKYDSHTRTDEELVRWYDREDHLNFDVCADDHCQRYQGITRASTETVRQAIRETWGEVLTSDGKLCDARFSKCCGGVFETFETCWEPTPYSYLQPKSNSEIPDEYPDLVDELKAIKFIESSPKAFCNTRDAKILSQVLNNYDQETQDFYRWTVEYTQDELSKLIKERSGEDYGRIKALEPVSRGTSGRIYRLRIIGEKQTLIIGKELEIRRTLSPSHLYSSAFTVTTQGEDAEGYPQKFILRGAGWGHGVGLCQIGAAVMGAKGFDYKEILLHHFINAEISKMY